MEQKSKQEVFIPEDEIRKVRRLPHEQKKNALAEFKQQLAEQEKAWAECRVILKSELEQNPDTPKEKLLAIVGTFEKSHGFGKKQLALAERIIDSYYRYRKNMKEVYEKCGGDARVLAEQLTGADCRDSEFLEVKEGIMSIDFLADNLTARRMRGEQNPNSEDRIILAGFKEMTKGEKPVMYTVVITPADNVERTKTHELEHVTNQLFQEEFNEMNSSQEINSFWEEYQNKKSETEQELTEKTASLRKYLLAEEKLALEKSKDEIIAHKKSGDERNVPYILLEPKREGGLYDYFSTAEERMKVEPDEPMAEVWKKLWQEIVVSDYQSAIEEGEKSFKEIAKNNSADFAIAMLSGVPLEKWPKTEARQEK